MGRTTDVMSIKRERIKRKILISAIEIRIIKWAELDLNQRHMDFQSTALPTELPARATFTAIVRIKYMTKGAIARSLEKK